VPPSPSPFARLLLLPLHLMRIPFVANAGNGMFRHALFAFCVWPACAGSLRCAGTRSAYTRLKAISSVVWVKKRRGGWVSRLSLCRLSIPVPGRRCVHKDLYKKANAVLTACEYEKAWFESRGVAPSSLARWAGILSKSRFRTREIRDTGFP